jgi:DNA-binding beta-propeller fold protein YncE
VDKFEIPGFPGRGAVSPDGARLCVISGQQTISIIDLSTKKAETITLGIPNLPNQAVWSRDGSKIYVSETLLGQGGIGSHIWVVDPTKKQPHKKLEMKPNCLLSDLLLAPPMPGASLASDRLYAICLEVNVASRSFNKFVVSISTTTDTIVEELSLNEGITTPEALLSHGALSADGKTFYVRGDDTVCILDTTTAPPKPNASLLEHPISPDDLVAYLSRRVTDF